MKVVNLSRRPFVNQRPVVRLAWILWTLGLLFLGANFWLYGSYWIESADIRGRLAEVESSIRQEEESLSELDQRFDALDLEDLNEQAAFLNQLIAGRTFPWSALFDHLEEALPRGVKLENLQPSLAGGEAQRRGAARRASRRTGRSRSAPRYEDAGPTEVQLSLLGAARSSDELLAFVDALYQHPSFRQPLLRNERLETPGGAPGSSVRFDLTTLYLVSPPSPADGKGEKDEEESTAPAANVTAQGVSPPGESGAAAGAPAAGTPAAGTPAAGTPAAGTPPPASPPRAAEPEDALAGLRRLAEPSAGSPSTGTPSAGTPSAGTPAAGTPAAGSPAAGAPRAPTADKPTSRAPTTGTILIETPAAGGSTAPPPAAGTGSPPPAPNAGRDPRFVTPGASGTPRLGGGGGQP